MAECILKVQVPINESRLGDPYLVYSEGRKFLKILPSLPQAVLEPLGDDLKGYFNANVENDGAHWKIEWGTRVDDQPW